MLNSKSPIGLKYSVCLYLLLTLCPIESVFCFPILSSIIQGKITIKGVVQTQLGVPLSNVTVLELQTSTSIQTNNKGAFSIEISENHTLQFSSLGYQSKQITFKHTQEIQIELTEKLNAIDELVVTAYGTSNPRNFTGSVDQIKGINLSKTASASFETALQGNVPGINVYTTGQPGAGSTVQIRGIGSINGIREPLYVLDGVVINSDNNSRIGGNGAVNQINPLSSINSNDIESIAILKDAAAASLYGSRAANGVVIITTKRGIIGNTELSVTANAGLLSNLTREKTINNQEFKDLWKMGQVNRYIQDNEGADYSKVYRNKDLFSKYELMAKKDYESIYGTQDVNSDWLDAIYRNGNNQHYSLSASGGSQATQFYLSGDYLKQNGTIIQSSLDRKSGRLNLENKARSWLNLGVSLSVSKSDRNSGQYDSEYVGGLNPLFMARVLPQAAPIYDKNGYMGLANLPNQIEKNANPIGVIEVGKYNNKDVRLRGSVYGEFNLPFHVKLKSTLGVDHQSLQETLYDNKVFGAGGGQWNGALYVAQGELSQYTSTNLLTYNKQILEHSFDVLFGFESQESKMKSINNSGYDILDSELLSSSSIGTLWSWNGHSENYSLLSYFSRLNYGFREKYFLSTSFRRDGSSRFGEYSKWGDFWSVSGAWLLSQENFLKNRMLNYLKLRASYGTNGNLPPNYYASLAYFTTAGKSYASESGLSYGQLANPDLSWELSRNTNIGIDGQLLNQFGFTLDYFHKKTTNLLLNIPVSLTTGFTSQLQNYGEMTNRGWELSLKYKAIDRNNFSWNVRLNATILKNKLTRLPADLLPTYNASNGQNPIASKVSESLNSFYLRDYAGVNPANGAAEYYVLKEGERTGEKTTNAEQAGFAVFGNALQKVQGGIFNQFNYKKLSLDILINYGLGAKAYDWTAFKRDDDGFLPQFTSTQAQLNPWTPLNPNSKIPIRINGNNSFSNDVSTRHLYKADYLKIRNMRLNYRLAKTKFFQQGTLYIQGDNLFLWTQLDDYDPEAIINAVNLFQTPTSRSVMLGIQFKI